MLGRTRIAIVLKLVSVSPTVACGVPEPSLEDQGAALAASTSLSPSTFNAYSCLTCHAETDAPSRDKVLPGASLAGATERPFFWGGQENDLLSAINACRSSFMGAAAPLTPEDPNAQALYAYLLSLTPGFTEPVPFTVERDIEDLPRGSAEPGLGVYGAACEACHGPIHTGVQKLTGRAPTLPEDTIAAHPGYSRRLVRLVLIEKVRHGPFLGYGGEMPPFSLEILSDVELSDILEALGVTGQDE